MFITKENYAKQEKERNLHTYKHKFQNKNLTFCLLVEFKKRNILITSTHPHYMLIRALARSLDLHTACSKVFDIYEKPFDPGFVKHDSVTVHCPADTVCPSV